MYVCVYIYIYIYSWACPRAGQRCLKVGDAAGAVGLYIYIYTHV